MDTFRLTQSQDGQLGVVLDPDRFRDAELWHGTVERVLNDNAVRTTVGTFQWGSDGLGPIQRGSDRQVQAMKHIVNRSELLERKICRSAQKIRRSPWFRDTSLKSLLKEVETDVLGTVRAQRTWEATELVVFLVSVGVLKPEDSTLPGSWMTETWETEIRARLDQRAHVLDGLVETISKFCQAADEYSKR